MAIKYAKRMNNLKASEIREILKLTERPEVISFAGGLPAPELFPIEEMKLVSELVLNEEGAKALQYSTTEGYGPLRDKIAKRLNGVGIQGDGDKVLITNGSQQGLDFSAKIFINEGDIIVCESPSYIGAINAFKAYLPEFVEIPTDDEGMIMEELEGVLSSRENVKMIYVIPDFQNPSGRTWSVERRKKLVELGNKYDLPIIEDNPYGELRFEGEFLPSVKSFDTEGRVIYLGTFSKTFCPGLRIGWVYADKELLHKYILIKQAADLHSNSMSQRELDKFLELYNLDEHIEKIKVVYRKRRNIMMDTIKESFPEGLKYTYPEGGLFTWVELPKDINARDLLIKALEVNVAFVPGGSFFPNGGRENTMRLNFSNMPEDRIKEGIQRLGKVIAEMMKQ
ncbi:aminotransferase-like domain-containing protein [Alkaliphilus serpentinus]|uniref:PLP-dependent aminotransferase family protein n=1 Tax=Alkaliphilus serpentinus TaxID=1482731 RepID=A0A833HQA7_9FIRM|nr:PLP-dependent aminotransferase family protein [Alkaliphilus serpentinus]KAB3531784.1 PLP-dependent aminotransferase family protein [Alkaliphilus serpentinus]